MICVRIVFKENGMRKNKKARNFKQTSSPKKETWEVRRSDDEEKGPPDFGGIPMRDLKKNLGCG